MVGRADQRENIIIVSGRRQATSEVTVMTINEAARLVIFGRQGDIQPGNALRLQQVQEVNINKKI